MPIASVVIGKKNKKTTACDYEFALKFWENKINYISLQRIFNMYCDFFLF